MSNFIKQKYPVIPDSSMINDNLLITCPGADGGLFLGNGEVFTRLSSRATTGLCVDDKRLIYAYQDGDGKSLRLISRKSSEEVLLNEHRLDLHDVLISDDKIYVVATETNEVICFDHSFKRLESWILPGENDSSHLNSAAFYRGRLLASAFGRFCQHREYKNGTVGRGEVIDIETGNTFIGGLSQPHSLTVIEDLLYLCCSEEKQVRVYRGAELIQKLVLPGYTRGLAFSGMNLYVGISLSRNLENVDNGLDSAAVAVIGVGSMQLKKLVPLPCSEIYDIRVVSDVAQILPSLLVDLFYETRKQKEVLELYKRGYESYKSAYESLAKRHDEVLSSKIWRCVKPLVNLEKIVRNKQKPVGDDLDK